MRTRPKAPVTESAPVRREDFASWSDYQDALAASDEPDDFEQLFELPQTLDDWIDYELVYARRWWASIPPLPGDPPPEFLQRARERALRNYHDTPKDPE